MTEYAFQNNDFNVKGSRGLVNGSIEMEFCQKKILQMSVSQQVNIALFSVSLYYRSVSSGLRAPESTERGGQAQGPLGWREAERGDVMLLKLLQGQPFLSPRSQVTDR